MSRSTSDPQANLAYKVAFTLRQRPDWRFVLDRLRNGQRWASLGEEIARSFPGGGFRGQVHHVEHHLAHLSSAFHVSPFEEAVLRFGRWVRRFRQRRLGGRPRQQHRCRWPRAVSRIRSASSTRRSRNISAFRITATSTRSWASRLMASRAISTRCADRAAAADDGSFRLESALLPPSHGAESRIEWRDGAPTSATLFSPALEELLGPRRAPSDPLEQRHSDIARSVQAMYEEAFFHLLDRAPRALPADRARARRRLRHEFGRQRQSLRAHAVPARLCAVGGGRCGRRHRRGVCRSGTKLGAHARTSSMDHAYWGPEFSDDEIEAAITQALAAHADRRPISLRRASRVRMSSAGARAAAIAERQGRRLVPGTDGMGAARARQPLDRVRSAPRRYEGHPQPQDQAPRIFRPFAPSVLREAVPEWFEDDDDVPFMMQVFQIRAEQAAADPGGHACRRLRASADGDPRRQSALLSSDRMLSRHHAACRWCSTLRSMRMSRWYARRAKRWTASCARIWICSRSGIFCSYGKRRARVVSPWKRWRRYH